jgi:DNA-binding XRE family transcriptional regulator
MPRRPLICIRLLKKLRTYLNFIKRQLSSIIVPVSKALKIYRELQGLTQAELAQKSGLKQATISSLEHDRVAMGVDRAKVLARALKVHPAVLAFADWDMNLEAA